MFQAFDSSFLTLILVGSVFAGITPLMLRGDQSVALCRCNGSQCSFDSCLQVICIVWLMLLIFLLATAYRFSIKFKSVSLAQKHHGHWTNFWYLLQCGQVPGSGKGQHLPWASENIMGQHQQLGDSMSLWYSFRLGLYFQMKRQVCVSGGGHTSGKKVYFPAKHLQKLSNDHTSEIWRLSCVPGFLKSTLFF